MRNHFSCINKTENNQFVFLTNPCTFTNAPSNLVACKHVIKWWVVFVFVFSSIEALSPATGG